MNKYVIEREVPEVGGASVDQLREDSTFSNEVISDLGPEIRWLRSYITDDKVYCVFVAPDEEILVEHARCAGIPADRISKVSHITDPSWGDK